MLYMQKSTVAESVPYDYYTLEHSCQINPRPVKHYALYRLVKLLQSNGLVGLVIT